MLALRVPALFELRLAFALERLAAHRRGEHAPGAPAPDFFAREILHHEVVRLAIGETQLEHLRSVVANVESEAEFVRIILRSGDVESSDDRRAQLRIVVLRSGDRFFGVGKRGSRGERD